MTTKELITHYALGFIGREYLWGGVGPLFDCSGFCSEILRAAGVGPPHDMSASQMFEHYKIKGEFGKIAWGSLVFYGPSTAAIRHIGFALNDTHMIEAGGGDASVRDIQLAQMKGAFIKVSPIKLRKDYCAAILPAYPFTE